MSLKVFIRANPIFLLLFLTNISWAIVFACCNCLPIYSRFNCHWVAFPVWGSNCTHTHTATMHAHIGGETDDKFCWMRGVLSAHVLFGWAVCKHNNRSPSAAFLIKYSSFSRIVCLPQWSASVSFICISGTGVISNHRCHQINHDLNLDFSNFKIKYWLVTESVHLIFF